MKKIFENRQMENISPIDQAKKAIGHVLRQRHDNPQLAYWIAPGSQSFALMTEAAATLWNEPIVELRSEFAAAKTVNPDAWRMALERIVNEFHDLNGSECDRGCGRCIKCIAQKALGGSE